VRDTLHVISLVLLLAASVWVAHERRRGSILRLLGEVLAGTALGGVSGALLIESSKRLRPDWASLAVLTGFLAGTLLGGVGSHAAAWMFEPSRVRPLHLAGSLTGALAGCFLAHYAVKAYDHGIDVHAPPFLIAMGALLIGSFATLGGRLLPVSAHRAS
jgi:hypothetical protein